MDPDQTVNFVVNNIFENQKMKNFHADFFDRIHNHGTDGNTEDPMMFLLNNLPELIATVIDEESEVPIKEPDAN
jgi:hypothetical protein